MDKATTELRVTEGSRNKHGHRSDDDALCPQDEVTSNGAKELLWDETPPFCMNSDSSSEELTNARRTMSVSPSHDSREELFDEWNVTMLSLPAFDGRKVGNLSGDIDDNAFGILGTPCRESSPRPDGPYLGQSEQSDSEQSSTRRLTTTLGDPMSQEAQQGTGADQNGESNERQQPEEHLEEEHHEGLVSRAESSGRSLTEEEIIEISKEFDPLRVVSEPTDIDKDVKMNAGGDLFQVMALTNEELNTFVSVIPNIKPDPLDIEAQNIVAELDRFEWDFEFRYKAMLPEALRNKLPNDQKAAAWQLAMGVPARQKLREVEWDDNESKDDIPTIKKKLIEAVSTPATRRLAVSTFWDAQQAQGESIKAFLARLDLPTAQAKWDKDRIEENMIVHLCRALRSKSLRLWIMAQPATTPLSDIRKHCLAAEALELEDQQLQDLNAGKEHAVYENNEQKKQGQGHGDAGRKQNHPPCSYCGTNHIPGKNPKTNKYNCPASGHVCSICGKRNHFEQACWKSKQDAGKGNRGENSPTKVKANKPNKKKEFDRVPEKELLIILNDSLQRRNQEGEQKAKKNETKRKKEKTRAVSESSDSSVDSEMERRILKAAKKLEKARAARQENGSSSDSTPPGSDKKTFMLNLSASSSDDSVDPQARSAFYAAFGRHDGGGGSRAGLFGGASSKSVENSMKPSSLLKDFRIPKITPTHREPRTATERMSVKKHKSTTNAELIRNEVSQRVKSIQLRDGKLDLLLDNCEKKNRKRGSGKDGSNEEITHTAVSDQKRRKKSWSENVSIEGKSIKMKVDLGSTVTILTWKDFSRLGLSESRLSPTNSRIVMYSGNRIIPLGKMKIRMSLRGRSVLAKILVIEEAAVSLLGFPEGFELGLFKVEYDLIAKAIEESVDECLSGKDRSEHDEIPETLEIPPCKFSAKLELKEGARPRILAPRRLPLAIRTKV